METDDSYVRSKSPETMTESIEVDLPWWADVIESTELAHVIRSPCDQKVSPLALQYGRRIALTAVMTS